MDWHYYKDLSRCDKCNEYIHDDAYDKHVENCGKNNGNQKERHPNPGPAMVETPPRLEASVLET